MKSQQLFTMLLCLAAGLCGCNEANDPPDSPTWIVTEPTPEIDPCPYTFPSPVPYPLDSTQWELVGSLDTTTGELTTYKHPKECTDCYSLTFDTDSTAIFRNHFQDYRIDLFHLDTCRGMFIEKIFYDDERVMDAWTLNAVIHAIGSYAAFADTLRLYYCPNQHQLDYLLFTRKES